MTESGAETQSSLESELGRVLQGFRSLSGEVDAAYVVSREGRLLASSLEDDADVDPARIGAMVSALAGLSTRRGAERGHERYSQTRVRAEGGYVLLTGMSDGSTLAATTGPEARAGLVLYDMRNARPEAERAMAREAGEGGVG